MIQHLRHEAIDKSWWDEHLARCADRNWYARSAVLDIASPRWEALVDRSTGALMPLTWRRKFGFRYLFQPYGLQQLGVFAPAGVPVPVGAFLDAVPAGFRYWDIRLNGSNTLGSGVPFRAVPHQRQQLALDRDAATIRAGYGENHRRNVRKAAQAAPYFTDKVGTAEFVALFRATTGRRYRTTSPNDMRVMHEMVDLARCDGECLLWGVRKGGTLHAAVCFIVRDGTVVLFKSASDGTGHEMRAMFHLVDRLIEERAGNDLLLDFAGSDTASVARFNTGFGATTSVYLGLVHNRLPVPFKWFKQ